MSEIDDIILKVSPYYKMRKKRGMEIPSLQQTLAYDSATETLEPLYFWILDQMNKSFDKVEKITDNFASSPGSGHFSELQGKASQMQQEASRVLGTVNNILKGVLNLIYDLKEFKIRLSSYEEANSDDKLKAEAGLLALKQIWMDKVDMQRGQGSINALTAGNLQFVTLRDAFLASKSLNSVDKLDLNEKVKRILKPRLQEFFEWRKRSEQELRKRFEIERIYLKSQVEALKLNTRWAKPYLKAAAKLMQSETLQTDAALVTAFNTIIMELTLMGINNVDLKKLVIGREKELPAAFLKMEKKLRKYYSVVFIELHFRGIPSKVGQHYVFGGRADVTFKAFALNQEELDLFRYESEQSDLNDALKLVQGMTDDSLLQLKTDINELLGEKEGRESKSKNDENPFSSLFSFMVPEKKPEKLEAEIKEEKLKKLKEKGIKPANYAEQYLKNIAEAEAMDAAFKVYDYYKKGHGMASVPYGGEKGELRRVKRPPLTKAERIVGFK